MTSQTSSIPLCTSHIPYLGIGVPPWLSELVSLNFPAFLKTINDDLQRCMNLPLSIMGKISHIIPSSPGLNLYKLLLCTPFYPLSCFHFSLHQTFPFSTLFVQNHNNLLYMNILLFALLVGCQLHFIVSVFVCYTMIIELD